MIKVTNPKMLAIVIVLLIASNGMTYVLSQPSENYCKDSIEYKKWLEEDEDFRRATGKPLNLNPNREGGLHITDKIR